MADSSTEPTIDRPAAASEKGGKGWAFRIAALVVGFLPLVILEGLLRAGDWGAPDPTEDPFVGFAGVQPLFALNEDQTKFTIAPSRRDWFYPVDFDAVKSPETVRVFCIGGSTVAGRPYTVETAFSTWLQLFLEHLDPETNWEVVNCGGVSYASYRLVPIVEEVVDHYEPDLLILYTGHNEFLEDRTYDHVKNLPAAVTRPYELASKLRMFNLMRRAYYKVAGKDSSSVMDARAIMAEEVDALLEHKGGMEHYYRDEEWHRGVIDHYEFNLDRICAKANEGSVPLIVMNPSSNLRDVPPFKSEHRNDLTEGERKEMEVLLNKAAKAFSQTETQRALLLYEEALGIDPLYADAHYQYAKLHDLLNQMGAAGDAYVKAKDLDVCPLRMLESMHVILKEVVDRHNVVWLDSRQEVKKIAVASGIPGDTEFLDHVHPNIGGHQFFAKLLVDKMAALGYVVAEPGWHLRAARAVLASHMESLPADYYAEGEIRLENLRHWARGRSEAEPAVESKRRKKKAVDGESEPQNPAG